MTSPTHRLQHRIYFSVTVQDRISLDLLAGQVSRALGLTLSQSSERGTMGDYEGESLGLQLWLYVAEPPTPKSPAQFVFVGGPQEEGDESRQIDIGSYVAEILTRRTGRPWSVRTP